MNSVFSEQILADKLSKLNSTQQCIETLSHWCIFHRSRAELVVATWEKQFHNSEMVQKVPLLYLANDILQNSKKKGNEFVTEFWKVLPSALRDVVEKDDDRGKNVVTRLIHIWEERRVFGSHALNLKDVMLGENVPPPLVFGKKRSRSVRIVKRDSRSIRTKLSIGGAAEKIVSAFHAVVCEQSKEEVEMNSCKAAINRVRKMEKDVDIACSNGKDPKRKVLAKDLEEEENLLKQCIEKLKSVEVNRVALVSQLKEALHEEESELENVRTQMQVAQAQAEEASNMRRRLIDDNYVPVASTTSIVPVDLNVKSGQTSKRTAASIAAEVADKLTASSSSQMIMHSVLSTFAAEEAKNACLTQTSTPSKSFTSKPEKPSLPISEPNVFMPAQPLSVLLPQTSMQNPAPSSQTQFHMLPSQPSQQYMQLPGGSIVTTTYRYNNISPLPPGPPLLPPPYMVSPVVPLVRQTSQPTHQQLMPLAQQQQGPITQQKQQVPMAQQLPGPPSFRPLQPPWNGVYSHPPPS